MAAILSIVDGEADKASPVCLSNCTTDVGADGSPMSGLLGEAVPSIDVCCCETT